jgi:hypothetical protein
MVETMTKLIYPLLNLIGGLWTTGKANPAQEHFISNLIRQKLIAAIETLPAPPITGYKIMLFLNEGESHEIGLLLAQYIAKEQGWNVYYLGQNVPLNNIDETSRMIQANLMFTTFINPRPNHVKLIFDTITSGSLCPLLYSGSLTNTANLSQSRKTVYLPSPSALAEYLRDYTSI